MSSPLYLYDDRVARAFEPFALTRPTGELRAGAEIVRHRWERATGCGRAAGFVAAGHLAEFEELDAPSAAVGVIPAGAIVANTRFVPDLESVADADVWTADGRVAAVRLSTDTPVARLADGALDLADLRGDGRREASMRGRWLGAVWDLIGTLGAQLAADIPRLAEALGIAASSGYTTVGAHPLFVESGATVDPFVVFDLSGGPVLVREGASVLAFTRVVGPCFVDRGATVVGDRVANCSIGEQARIHGEISTSIVLGHSNKAHEGFVGHSYLGRWVNLGAGTTTSNLKNTYGSVAFWTPGGMTDSGQQFLGTFFGDHAKTGIGLQLTTGTVVGAGANVYGTAMPAKVVPPFSWGEGRSLGVYSLDKFVEVAARAMARRQVSLGERGRRQLAAAHAARWSWEP